MPTARVRQVRGFLFFPFDRARYLQRALRRLSLRAYDWLSNLGEDCMAEQQEDQTETADSEVRARREFLKKCSKYAAAVPPVMLLLMTRNASAGPSVGSPG